MGGFMGGFMGRGEKENIWECLWGLMGKSDEMEGGLWVGLRG